MQTFRFYTQLFFIAVCLWIGIEFHLFVSALEYPVSVVTPSRPPGVEAFLPISALMSFLYFLKTGIIHTVHPAGFFMFMGFIAVSLVAGKSFCSWICPVGFVSEMTGALGKKLMPKYWKIPRWLDIPLRSLKYLLLLFFANAIFSMTAVELGVFLNSDYNIVADIKMYEFFRYISFTSLVVLTVLFFLSIVFQNFWCRYLCPYGALLGIVGLLSPTKIKRNAVSCIDCSLCDKACPSGIKVSSKKIVISDECTSCNSCVDACPVNDTLYLQNVVLKKKVSGTRVFIAAGLIYFLIVSTGFALGKWQNQVSTEKYKAIYQVKDAVGH